MYITVTNVHPYMMAVTILRVTLHVHYFISYAKLKKSSVARRWTANGHGMYRYVCIIICIIINP